MIDSFTSDDPNERLIQLIRELSHYSVATPTDGISKVSFGGTGPRVDSWTCVCGRDYQVYGWAYRHTIKCEKAIFAARASGSERTEDGGWKRAMERRPRYARGAA